MYTNLCASLAYRSYNAAEVRSVPYLSMVSSPAERELTRPVLLQRITMVTSFRAKDPRIMDASGLYLILFGFRARLPISFLYSPYYDPSHHQTESYQVSPSHTLPSVSLAYFAALHFKSYQWSLYRLKLLSERFAATARDLELAHAALPPDDDKDGLGGSEVVKVEEMEKWIMEQVGYLERTGKELAKTVEKESGDAYLNMTGPGTIVSAASAKVARGRMWGVGAGVLLCVFGAAQWALS